MRESAVKNPQKKKSMTTLRKGSKGEDVKTLQRLLGITVDGDFGAKTEAAVKAFQKAHADVCGTADGVVGDKTWAALGRVGNATNGTKAVDSSVEYCPLSSCLTKSPNRNIKYLIIHYTAGSTSAAGSAKAMKRYWEKARNASADFGVDDGGAVQFNPDPSNYYCWAVSGGNGIYNSNSISIEICSNLKKGTDVKHPNHEGWYFTEASLDNAVKLAKILMKKYNIPIERVVRHYDVTKKLCPGIVGYNDGMLYNTDGTKSGKKNNSQKWLAFKWGLR